MKNLYAVGLMMGMLLLAFRSHASAQIVVLNDGGNTWTLSSDSFNSDAEGVSTLSDSSPNFVADLSTLSLPAGLPDTGSGWVFQGSAGTLVISSSGGSSAASLALGDPFVAYSYAFYNSTSSSQNFSMQFVSTFGSTTYDAGNPAIGRASFGLTLTDANDIANATASGSEVATLSYVDNNMITDSMDAGLDLTIPQQTATAGDTVAQSTHTAGYPGYVSGPNGTFNTLTVTVSGTYSPGAEVSVSGRADVIPEPSSTILAAGGLILLVGYRRLRQLRT